MRVVLRALAAFLRADIAIMLQYRGEILLWAVWGLVNPAVLYAMWGAAATSSETQEVAGFSKAEFAAYYLIMMIIGHVSAAWDAYEMGFFIRTGQFSPKLLRPILPMWNSIATNLAYKITTLAFLVPVWLLFAWLVRPAFDVEAWQVAAAVPATLLGSALNYMLGYLVALVAFWTPRLDAAGEVYFGVGMFFGGRFAPLAALPAPLGWIAQALPFRWMFAFPAELAIGKIDDPAAAATGLVIQLAWLGILIVAFRFGWAAAVKRYTAVSG